MSQRDVGRSGHSPRRRQVAAIRATFPRNPSMYLWEDDTGETHWIPQGEGEGEQGDPVMPMLVSLGMHPALRAAQARLRPSERIFAFLDDVCVVCLFERVQTVVSILAAELWYHAHIQAHDGKTHVWNRAGEEPVGIHELTARARIRDPNAVVWRGDAGLDPSQCGLSLGSTDWLRRVREDQVARHGNQTGQFVAENPRSAGSSECVATVVALRGPLSQFLHSYGETSIVGGVCRSS